MMNKKWFSFFARHPYIFFLAVYTGCIVPEEPKFEFKEDLIYIDALASTSTGTSYVTISKSVLRLEAFINEFISGANVSFRNIESGLVVALSEDNGTYLPPSDFVVAVGETWELNIDLPDGKRYRSRSEKILQPTTASNIKATYNPELVFRADLKRFVPGHFITIDVNDPVDEENYYYWKFRSFEKLLICESCPNQFFRNGKCIKVNIGPNVGSTSDFGNSDYYCESECWRIRYNENIKLFSDEFAVGGTIKNVVVGDVLLYTNENTVVEIQQISLTEDAYDYYKVLKDIVDNSSGLNAPPPAALIGNVFNPDDEEEFILGRFTAASSTTLSVFIERELISESTIEPRHFFKSECFLVCGPAVCEGPSGSCDEEINFTSCTETYFRTGIKPEAWID